MKAGCRLREPPLVSQFERLQASERLVLCRRLPGSGTVAAAHEPALWRGWLIGRAFVSDLDKRQATMRPPCATVQRPASHAASATSPWAPPAGPSWRSPATGARAAGAGTPARPPPPGCRPSSRIAARAEQHPDRRHEQLASGVEELRDVEADPRYRRCAHGCLPACIGAAQGCLAAARPLTLIAALNPTEPGLFLAGWIIPRSMLTRPGR